MGVALLIKRRVKFIRNLEHFCLFQNTLLTTMIARVSFPVTNYNKYKKTCDLRIVDKIKVRGL
jgi:hypothetical protein